MTENYGARLGWEIGVDFPEWGNTPYYISTITGSKQGKDVNNIGYLLPNETPRDAYYRVAKSVSQYIGKPELADKFFDYIWRGWLCLASPVLSNSGTDRGLPISCYGVSVSDSIYSIGEKTKEMMLLTKEGGGVGVDFSNIRPSGTPIGKANGTTNGVVPFCKIFDSAILATSQGSVRKGSIAINLDIDHPDFEDWLNIRSPKGDVDRQCMHLHLAAVIKDDFMHRLLAGDADAKRKWTKLLRVRKETGGEPYVIYIDNINKANPLAYKQHNLKVSMSNICCLAEGTPILTQEGIYPIEDLCHKNITIWDGNYWVNNNQFNFQGYDKIYKITLADGSVIKVNGNHRWFVHTSYSHIKRNTLTEKITTQLQIGDFIEYHSKSSIGTIQIEGAYIKGFLLGDGTCNKNIPILNLHSCKYMCIKELLHSLSEIPIDKNLRSDCIITPSFSKEKNFTEKYEDTYGLQVFKKLKGLSSRKSKLALYAKEYKKEFPLEVWGEWDVDSRLKFLAGLFDADGCFTKGGIQWANKSKSLVYSIQLMLKSLGYTANFGKIPNGYRLNLAQQDSIDFISKGFTQRITTLPEVPNRSCSGWRKIVKIEETTDIQKVYCTSVPSTTKFALANGLMTGNSEITLYTDEYHSFVCCLSSLNLTKYDEWKDTDLVETGIIFLNGALNEFIEKGLKIKGLECAVRSAVKGRALGLGVLGWGSLLQDKNLPFESKEANELTIEIFSLMKERAEKTSKELALEYGEPEWCLGTGMYNSHLLAVAPTVSNSKLSGDVSPGIEPWTANYFAEEGKMDYTRKNKKLEEILESLDLNTPYMWKRILADAGSIQNIEELEGWYIETTTGKLTRNNKVGYSVKEIFKTFVEINQMNIIIQQSIRQEYIDQAVSLNLMFNIDASPKFISQVHLEAWRLGVKTLYYYHNSSAAIKADTGLNTMPTCTACDG